MDQTQASGKDCAEWGGWGGEINGSSPRLSPGQPVREKEVLLDVIDQGAPHFLHHLEDAFKVVELQGS